MDTKPLEEQAESYVKSELLRFDFNVIKPSFDRDGTDLLIIDGIENKSTHFLKIQCKGRKIDKNGTNVKIPKKYVQENFILFIYTIDTEKNMELYAFFSEDIEEWSNSDGTYSIYLSSNSLKKSTFKDKIFNKSLAELINVRLQVSKMREFTTLIIDGIFIEKAITKAISYYEGIYPDKELLRPCINSVVINILEIYSYYFLTDYPINCHVYYYEEDLEKEALEKCNNKFKTEEGLTGRVYIDRTDDFVWAEIITHVRRVSHSENIILVVNDQIYDIELNNFMDKNMDLILITNPPSFTNYISGDIIYPLAKSMGLEAHEF